MTDQKKDSRTEDLQDELSKRGRDVWLAGLGALATVEEEGTKLFSRLVERGKDFETSRRKNLEAAAGAAAETAEAEGKQIVAQFEEATEGARTYLTDAVENALDRLGVPSRKEVDQLSEKVDGLSAQIDALTAQLAEKKGDEA